MQTYGRMAFGLLAGVALAISAAACGGAGNTGTGSSATGGGKTSSSTGGGGAATAPTTLPTGLTQGCVGDDSDPASCVYGGLASAPSGIPAFNVNQIITADKVKLVDPMALTKNAQAPGGSFFSTPTGNQGDALVAVNIPSDGFYQILTATSSADTTTGTDSFYFGFGTDEPPQDNDHADDLLPDATWHKLGDPQGGGLCIRHANNTADAPDHIDTWHLKKGVAVLHFEGRENNSMLAQIEVVPAKASK